MYKLAYCLQPKFLSAEERAALAIKRREEEIAELRRQQEEQKQKRSTFIHDAKRATGLVVEVGCIAS
jgi:hypothetical protein